MRVFGFDLSLKRIQKDTAPFLGGGWTSIYPGIREPYTGAWQKNDSLTKESVLAYFAVYSCITLIAGDVSKMRLKLVKEEDGVWQEVENPAFSPVLRKPNRYQNRISFFQWWMISKLVHGNTYVLKVRDRRGVVVAHYILDPQRVKPLVAPDGSVFYQLTKDNLSNVEEDGRIVPAREIMHDVMVPLYHPLCGVSPLYACGMAALQGLKIQENSTSFFANGSQPGGVISGPGHIKQESADRVKNYWDTQFSGENAGKVAVLGDGLEYTPLTLISAQDAQLIEQLKFSAEQVCSVFHVPPYMIGVSPPPNYNNIAALNQQYYSQCLQTPIEMIELLLDEGMGLAPDKVEGVRYGTEFDLDDLLKMDSGALIKSEKEATGLKRLNESRRRLGLPKVSGGDDIWMQRQYYSLAALQRRDEQGPAPAGPAPPPDARDFTPDITALMAYEQRKAIELGLSDAA